jgi:glycosyltransferase involved in cell wall biosynthesis
MADVTVLMATYNDERYVEAAARSILAQSFHDFEFLIVDDASSDETPRILSRLAREDDRMRVLRLAENVGLAAALNIGLEAATSPIIARMDGDDISRPDRLEAQLLHLREHPEIDILGTYARDIDEAGVPTGEVRKVPLSPSQARRLVWTGPVIHPSAVFRRDRILAIGGYDPGLRRRQDYELWFRAVGAGLVIANLPEPFLDYRVRNGAGRTDIRRAWEQAGIGWRGCRLVKAGPIAYLGITFPLVVSLAPERYRRRLKKMLSFLDPRKRG